MSIRLSAISTAVLFIGGIILTCMGILGLYTSKLYLEVKNRPIYIVKEEFDKTRLSIKAHLLLSPHYLLRRKRSTSSGTKPSRCDISSYLYLSRQLVSMIFRQN